MKNKLFISCACATLVLAGCATTNNQSAQKDTRDEVYVTGSRLPTKTGGSGATSATDQQGYEEATRGHKQINPQGR